MKQLFQAYETTVSSARNSWTVRDCNGKFRCRNKNWGEWLRYFCKVSASRIDNDPLARTRFRQWAFGISQGQMADALVLSLNSQVGQPFFPLGQLEHLSRTVNPAGGQSEAVGGQHHRGQGLRTIIYVGGRGLLGEYDDIDGRAVERVLDRQVKERGVDGREAATGLLVLHTDDGPRLAVVARGRKTSSLYHLLYEFVGNGFIAKLTHAAACLDGLYDWVHSS